MNKSLKNNSMKKYLFYFIIAATMIGCSNDTSTESPGDGRVEVELRVTDMKNGTRVADEYAVHDLNYYVCNRTTQEVQHFYTTSSVPQRCKMIPGSYLVFVLANVGEAVELLTQAEVEAYALATEQLGDPMQTGVLWMSGAEILNVPQERSVEVRLTRCVAKLRLTVEVAETFTAGFRLHTMQLKRMPQQILPFGTLSRGVPSFDGPKADISGTPYSATLYLPENRAGDVPSITDPRQRNLATAPQDATYLLLTGEYDGRKVEYVVLIGENDTSNFDICRNGVYDLTIRISGVDSIDTRVAVTGMTLGTCAMQYPTSQALDSSLTVYCRNKPHGQLLLACEIVQGDGMLTLNGRTYSAPLVLPAGEHYFAIDYRQTTPGTACLRFRLADHEGYAVEQELTTTFVTPAIQIAFEPFTEPVTYTENTTTFTLGREGYNGMFELTCDMSGLDAEYSIDGQRVRSGDKLQLAGGKHTLTLESEVVGTADFSFTFHDTDHGEAQLVRSIEIEPLVIATAVEVPHQFVSKVMVEGDYTGRYIDPIELRLRFIFERPLPEAYTVHATVLYTLQYYVSLSNVLEAPKAGSKIFTIPQGETSYQVTLASYEGYCIGYSSTGDSKLLNSGYAIKHKAGSEEFETTINLNRPTEQNIRLRRITF